MRLIDIPISPFSIIGTFSRNSVETFEIKTPIFSGDVWESRNRKIEKLFKEKNKLIVKLKPEVSDQNIKKRSLKCPIFSKFPIQIVTYRRDCLLANNFAQIGHFNERFSNLTAIFSTSASNLTISLSFSFNIFFNFLISAFSDISEKYGVLKPLRRKYPRLISIWLIEQSDSVFNQMHFISESLFKPKAKANFQAASNNQ